MSRTRGVPDLRVGLIDGPVLTAHPGLSDARIEFVDHSHRRTTADDVGCDHATAVAGILVADRGSGAPGICPGVTLLVRPIFSSARPGRAPTADLDQLASAIIELADSGVRLINMSLVLNQSCDGSRALQEALDCASSHGLILVAAAGSEAAVSGSAIVRHRCVVPVVAFDQRGRPARLSNLGHTIGRRGVGAPTAGLVSLGGTSAAAAIVTGVLGLLASEFPEARSTDLVRAVTRPETSRRSIVPPMLDAWRTYLALQMPGSVGGRRRNG
jgi:subtilisin family serine protease